MIETIDTLPRPKRTRGAPTEDGDFVAFEHVAVFDQHEGDDGVYYDADLLTQIAANCNRRIRDTGDYVPVTLAHTREENNKRSVDDNPRVIGLAGPFYIGQHGNEQPRPCIFATFWIFPECEKDFLANPRRSVEIWPEERPEDRYFDPVAVLGAETPKRDLGMIYSRSDSGHHTYVVPGPFRYAKRRTGKLPTRYQVTSTPGPQTTFIPEHVKTPRKYHDEGEGFMLSQDELQQIIEALKPLVQAAVDEATQGEEISPPTPQPETPDMPPDLSDEDRMYARGLGRKFMKYVKDGEIDKGADDFMGSLDDEDRGALDNYMKYMCKECDAAKQKYAEKYARSPIGGDDLTEKPGDSTPSGSMNADEMKEGEPQRYKNGKQLPSKKIDPDKAKQILEDGEVHGTPLTEDQRKMFGAAASKKYSKTVQERDETVQKYRKLNDEHEDLKQRYAKQEQQLAELATKERYAKRYAALKERESEGYVLEVDEEMELIEDLTDEQFDRHVNSVIPTRYQRVTGQLIQFGQDRPPKFAEDLKPQKYAKSARTETERLRKAGHPVTYKAVMDNLIEHNGTINEEALLAHAGNGKP